MTIVQGRIHDVELVLVSCAPGAWESVHIGSLPKVYDSVG